MAAVHRGPGHDRDRDGLWAINGQLQDPTPRRMTVALDRELASLRPYGADDQMTAFTPDRIAIEKLDGRVVSEIATHCSRVPFR